LNNISENSNLGLFLNKQFRKIIPVERNKEIILKKTSKCILFDFDDSLEIMEFRCYSIISNSLLLPRKVRKLKKFKKMDITCSANTVSQKYCTGSNAVQKVLIRNKIKNNVRVIEIGPRITTKILI